MSHLENIEFIDNQQENDRYNILRKTDINLDIQKETYEDPETKAK